MRTRDELPTPCLQIDLKVAKRNIKRLADYAAEHKLSVRPHTKTHKSLVLSRLQMEAGAGGLTIAKVGEGEVMAGVSRDLLLGYPTLDAPRTERVAKLAHDHAVHVAVDSKEAVDALAAAGAKAGSTIGILVDLDVGFHRTGLQTPAEALDLAKHAARANGVRLDGLFCYPGNIWLPVDQQPGALATVESLLAETLELWTKAGLEAEIVTGGSTPTAYQSHHIAPLTDIRPGTYVYNDMNTVYGGFCTLDDCAARVACTVVSNAVPGKVVLDAGSKTLTTDRNFPQPDSGHGYVVEYPGAKIVRLSEEHGEVDLSACERKPRLGERVHVVPNHICPCVNLQDAAWLIHDDGSPEALRIDARGLLS